MKPNEVNSWIEIDSQAFISNIKQIHQIISSSQKIALVVKSNAYGHDMLKISNIAEKLSEISYLCTANLNEAISLKQDNIKKPIIIVSYISDNNLDLIAQYDIQPTIYDLDTAIKLNSIAKKLNRKIKVHIKLDTGMNRLGVSNTQIVEFIKKITKLSNLTVASIFTHLCDTSNPESNFSILQLKNFDNVIKNLKLNDINIPYLHALSSSGLYLNPKYNYDFLRIGGLAYGLWKSKKHKNLILNAYPDLKLTPILNWKTRIIQIKSVKEGDFIGYNRSFQVNNQKRIAILPVGYADGLTLSLSNKGYLYIKNQKVQILGIISMNLTIIDITNLSNIAVGQEVSIVDSDIDLCAFNLAQSGSCITNELITRIPNHIPRIYK